MTMTMNRSQVKYVFTMAMFAATQALAAPSVTGSTLKIDGPFVTIVSMIMWLFAGVFTTMKIIDLFKGDANLGTVFSIAGVIAIAYWWKDILAGFLT